MMNVRRPLQCVQEAGEVRPFRYTQYVVCGNNIFLCVQVLFVPAAWAQGDINLADSVGISSEIGYTNHTAIDQPGRYMKKEKSKKKSKKKANKAWESFANS